MAILTTPARLPRVSQAAILCGGLGTRLGPLTRSTPKPLLPVGGRPFLEILIEEVARRGVDRFLLLSAFEHDQMADFAAGVAARLDMPLQVSVSVEPDLAGTGGALWHARHQLDDVFYAMNGDSLFDAPIAELSSWVTREPGVVGALLLRQMPADARYGVVDLQENTVVSFESSHLRTGEVAVNAGVYCFGKALFDWLSPECSLEREVLPRVATAGGLRGVTCKGAFIDIGIPADYELAQSFVGEMRRRPAIFINLEAATRSGTLMSLARIVRAANDAGAYVFASLEPARESEEEAAPLPPDLSEQLQAIGANIDDVCIHHVDDIAPVVLQLARRWPVNVEASFLVGFDARISNQVGVKTAPLPQFEGQEQAGRWLQGLGVVKR